MEKNNELYEIYIDGCIENDFNGLNGTFNQYVKKIETNDISYPLEYFSLDSTLEDDGNGRYVSRLEKDITFVLE